MIIPKTLNLLHLLSETLLIQCEQDSVVDVKIFARIDISCKQIKGRSRIS